MFGKRSEPTIANTDRVDTILGKNAEFNGKIKSSGLMRIEGNFDGELECDEDLIISEGAKVTAELKARNAIIAGVFQGNIQLDGKLEIKNTGKVTGDIKVGTLLVEDGAFFDGKCEMLGAGHKPDLNLVEINRNEKKTNPT
ncbi:conserved protein of unknown function [Tepidanaerobacter acetatoxydans Re1]|uniref:Integral membrane protein CcmA involved in cell shape determination n=1 Tax=Tepidanaerobacter acetatoxydans (strain DSM 21804 / JCM 16047 / Re1) TaxID=1209989 RepID=F4LV77_TEPAE|nr:polymer-forming cytoskeletal protein [Tepidanaerobacter acetatoxydans]AEE92724.1 protein of unknown function DUF583 [Tepidanaerobacter acetatoxydans Re1]CDI41094.1 conserved protein of unknown function [Tepidanaerobacter acetatoxydans Re1]